MQLADCEAVLVTQSEHGMTLVPRKGEAVHVPAHPVKVRDVSGAGDTVAAVLAVSLAAGADWETALRTANAAAAVAVSKKGTAVCHIRGIATQDHAACLSGGGKKRSWRRAATSTLTSWDWRRQGLRIGFTNGCFDILHPGHVKVLTAGARRLRPPDRRPEQRRIGEAAEGRGTSGAERARAFRSAGGAGGGRSGGDLRRRHPARPDHADRAERAGEGRRLHPRKGRRSRDRRGRRRREVVLVDILPGFSTTSLVNRARGGEA